MIETQITIHQTTLIKFMTDNRIVWSEIWIALFIISN